MPTPDLESRSDELQRVAPPPVEAVAIFVALAIVALARLLESAARRLARVGGAHAVARVEAAETPTPRYTIYTTEMLEASLRGLEGRFTLSTERFIELYEQDALPSTIPRHTANVWAGLRRELVRLRVSDSEAAEVFRHAVAL